MSAHVFGERLRELRETKSLSRRELGERLGYSKDTILYWEYRRGFPHAQALVDVATFFQVSIDWLLDFKLKEK